jgi:hypothetical protein
MKANKNIVGDPIGARCWMKENKWEIVRPTRSHRRSADVIDCALCGALLDDEVIVRHASGTSDQADLTDLDLYTGLPKVGNSLAVWADDARQAASVAVSLAPTPFVPQSLRGRDDKTTAANITAAILTGAELGLTPMASLRSIVVIQGTPAMTAVALRGLVQSAGHEVWVEVESSDRAGGRLRAGVAARIRSSGRCGRSTGRRSWG